MLGFLEGKKKNFRMIVMANDVTVQFVACVGATTMYLHRAREYI
jgi:hypothetical protein